MVPKNSLVKLSEGDGRIFKFSHVDASFGYIKAENNTTLKLPVTRDVIVVGKYSEEVNL
jgi:hypothetical protein